MDLDGSGPTAANLDAAGLDAVAIVGASCRLPGAPDLPAFERLLFAGTDAVGEIPDGRWAKGRYFHPSRGQPGKTYTYAAGVIGRVDGFDAAFFGISPREAAQMDPQQRLLLELAHEAIEDAGLDGAALAGTAAGVYVGASSWDYQSLFNGDPAVTDAYSMTGATLCSLANRVSFAFDLHGPSMTMDTACSSSLVALHQACEAIRAGQVTLALVGGVNLLLSPGPFIGFSAASMLSPRGRCHAFDARADGYVRAEGGAVVVLRPLREALARGDTIRALIRGTGMNSDGRTTGLSLPSRAAQAELLRSVYGRFGIDPQDLGYLEAHGTGTPAGDPIEAGALGEVLGRGRATPLPIGSVKTNIGHLEAASGMAGLLKAMLVLQRGVVPASLHCETPNPAIPFGELNLRLMPEASPLAAGCRLAGVNSFGFGGTNAHAVLETADGLADVAEEAGETGLPNPPLLLSARSTAALHALAENWRGRLESGEVDGAALRGAAMAREAHRHRLAVLGADVGPTAVALGDWLAGRGNHDAVAGEAAPGKVAFVFSGNGSQWSGMGLAASAANPRFRRALAEVDAALLPHLGWSVAERLARPGGWAVEDTTVAQPLLFAVQVATTEALREAGIDADLFLGHSVGEVAAAWAAGALHLPQACQVIAIRSRLQALTAGHGRMAVLGIPPAQAESALAGTGLEIAAFNSSTAVTVAGPAEALERLAERAATERWPWAAMELDHAFHSAAMDPVEAPLRADLAALRPLHCPASFISTVLGGPLENGARLDAAYWWRNVRAPVRFSDAAAEAVARGARILVEVGPQPVLQGYLRDALTAVDGRAVSTLLRRAPEGRDPVALAAARCHVAGADMRGAAMFAGPRQHRSLPAYPWQRERHWRDHTAESTDVMVVRAEHPLLGARREPSEALEWSSHLGPSLQRWLGDHVVGGAVVAPAALLVEMAFAAARARYPGAAALQLLDFEIARPMTFEPDVLRDVRLRVDDATAQFQVASRTRLSGDRWTVHATGQLVGADTACLGRPLAAAVVGGGHTTGAALYARAAAIGLEYGPAFQVVTGVDTAAGQQADVALAAPEAVTEGVLLPPTLLDGAFQGLVGLAAGLLPRGDGVVPWRFGRVSLLQPAGTVPCSARVVVTRTGPRSVRADIHLLDAAGEAVAELLDCWFVRVQLHSGRRGVDHAAYHVAMVASADPHAAPAGALLPVLRPAGTDAEADDAHLLAEAFAGAAVAEAVRLALPEPDAAFTVGGLAAAGLVPAGGRDRCAELLGWLQADGLAVVNEGQWRLAASDGALADDILRTLVFDTPETAADAALLAGAAESLESCLRANARTAMSDHLLTTSPAAEAAGRALADGLACLARAWPAGLPFRVLHLGARRGALSRRLLRALQAVRGDVVFHAVTEPGDVAALADALTGFPGAAVSPAEGGVLPPDIGRFDVAAGFGALTLGTADLATILPAVAGGLLLLAEPGPSRVWSLLWPDAASRLHDGAGWALALADAGVADSAANLITGGWGASLLSARVAAVARRPEPAASLAIIADPATILADGIEQAQAPATVVDRIALADAEAAFARWAKRPGAVPGRVALVTGPEDDLAPWLDRLARCAAVAPQPCSLTVVTQAGPLGAALGGLRRVMANEMPNVTCRQVTLAAELPMSQAIRRAAAELADDDGEPEVTWTVAGRIVPRLRPGLPVLPQTSAAVRLGVARPGLLDTVGWDAAEPAVPGRGQVAIRVHAAGLNFRDVMWAMGMLPDEALLDGFAGPTLGLECAGEVTAVGADVTGFAPGDRVMAFAPASLGSHVVTAAHAAVLMPVGLGYASAATIPVAFMTVAYALGHLARLEAGERVLVHGGAGGVGLAAIQYAKHRGAVVFATAGTAAKRAMLRRLGVDAVLDSRSLAFADEVLRLTGGEGVDVVLNSLNGAAMELSLKLLRPFGRFLELGKRDFYGNTRVGLRPLRHNIAYHGVDVDQLPLHQPRLAAALLTEIAGMMAEGALRPLPYRVFDAADAADAFRVMQASGHIGKIVLALDGPVVARPVRTPGPAVVRADRCYVVTGGLDGFGLQAAHWLADQGAVHLALLSRRGPDAPGAAEAIAGLRAKGATAVAYACDVADDAALAGVLDVIRAAVPLGGVIHAAVAMDDGLLPAMDAERFEQALRPKLHGAAALDRLTRADPVELFVVFSSVTTVLGNPGQANYVAANAAAEAVVEARRREGLPGLAVQWGPIGDAGYLARERGVADQLSKRLGETLMTAAEALAALPMLLGSGVAVAGLARVRWGLLAAGLPLLQAPMFAAVCASGAEGGPSADLAAMLADCTPEEAQAKLTVLLTEEVARIMRMPAGAIQPHRPLMEFGMDSLMAVELRLAVEQRVGLTLPVMALSDGVTLTALAARMARAGRAASAEAPDEMQAEADRISRFELTAPSPDEEAVILEDATS